MREHLRGLTLRGRAVLGTGLVVAVVALALGQRDLLRVAVLLVALPLVAVLVLSRRDDRVAIGRTVQPDRVPVGGTAVVRLRLQNTGNRPSAPLLVADHVDAALGEAPRLVLERLEPGGVIDSTYRLEARVRGRHRIGPLTLTLEDPFGLVRTSRLTSTTHTLTVAPLVVPLPAGRLTSGTGGSGDGAARRASAAGQDDIGTREYRSGDELRRVHWRATARTGALMVRQEEQPWEAQALVVLDTRRRAHQRATAGPFVDLTTSSFEWGVHAAASIGAHLAQSERRVRLVAGRTDVAVSGGATGPLIDALATVRTDPDGLLLAAPARRASVPVVVAVLGRLDDADVGAVAALRQAGATCVAIVLDTTSWSEAGVRSPVGPRSELAAPLVAAGWRVAVAARGELLADVWARAMR